jgi:hypothetical protein
MANELSPRIFTDEYYRALGQFVSRFSEIEGAMQVVLWHFANVRTSVGRAVFSGVRADDACNKITRISDADNWPEGKKAQLKIISDRLGILRTFRNDILHYGGRWESVDTWVVTNELYAHVPSKIKNTPVTTKILEYAASDLEKLGAHIFYLIYGDQLKEENRQFFNEALERAWLYTPPQQAVRMDDISIGAPQQSRPHRASARERR